MTEQVDVVVVGLGPGGEHVAGRMADAGLRVAGVEAELVGGECPPEEPESSALASEVLSAEGLAVRTGARAAEVSHSGAGFTVRLEGGEELTAECLLVATGRRVDLSELGMDTVDLDPGARALEVDGRMSAGPGLWAIGDVTGRGAFTHMAMYQAEIAARALLNEPGPEADYRAVPRVTFTDPEIGAVGLTEQQARERNLRVRTGVGQVPTSTRGWIHKAGNQGFIKLVEDADRGVLVGATSAGPMGGEVLYGLAVAVQAEVPVERLRHMIYAYPTFRRGMEDALAALR
ncbi:FAD-dependent oxidoreductase [Streptomyces sp. H27-D2]|uniref:FAD-dependent oxidoreductase n=1 Tax=Streptomyces sp. H27-D2 TaxID=3046304 RepID=UPI002DB9E28E|nr:FAD-dependent oxidoreductase [Streptomyces sp. H27-D2]MEC4020783.1 FAD-dependent oxidoreductase [Streptomyces sp. H27-D2]